ncbi:MAG: HAD family phosphatase [Clostridia bacterium]|nr:HAD family phosphatase [Clostridia bacterium]
MKNIKAAIFDLDGTLIDSMYVWEKVDVDFMMQRGIPVSKEYTDIVRSMFFETAAAYTKDKYGLDESVEEIMQTWLDMAHNEYAHHIQAKPYVVEYLKKLKEKSIILGIATSNNPYLLKPCLENNGMNGIFSCICYTSEVGLNKSSPDIYLYTAEKLGVKPEECVVFEDIIEGIKSAKSVGMKTVAVYDSSNDDYMDQIKVTADKFVETYSELLDEMDQ